MSYEVDILTPDWFSGSKNIVLPLTMIYYKNGELTFDRFDPLPDRIEELETVLAQEIKTRPRKNK